MPLFRTQSAAKQTSLAPHDSKARLRVVTTRRDSWRSHVHRTHTAQRVQSFKLQTANVGGRGDLPSPFSGGFKGGILFEKRIPPLTRAGNVKKCAVGKHPKSEKHGNTAQFSEVERSGTQENCGGIGSGCRLRLRPLPVLRRRQSQRVARIDPNAVVVDKNIAENDRFDLFSR